MIAEQIEIQIIAVIVGVACSLPGTYLVLRQMAMMSDAISHAILPGIVIGFFLTESLQSPWLIAGAAATGLLTVFLVETIQSTRLLKEDSSMGIVFPVLFSIGVILIARFASDVHLDIDAVLLGELALSVFDRLVIGGVDLGPRSMYAMGVILLVNLAFVTLLYKELKLATFDAAFGAAMGFSATFIHYALMTLVSVTAVGAFDAVGSILVVAFMVGPPATAYLLTDRLGRMLTYGAAIGAIDAVAGYWLAHTLDASIAGGMATMIGAVFLIVFLVAPDKGIVSKYLRRKRQRWSFAEKMLVIHLMQHEGGEEEVEESRAAHLQEHFNWKGDFADAVLRRSERDGYITLDAGRMFLTSAGRELAVESIVG